MPLARLDAVAHELNDRPRQTLNWMKPSQALADLSTGATLKPIVVNSPPELREELEPLRDKALMNRCAGFRRSATVDTTTASARHTLRSIARR